MTLTAKFLEWNHRVIVLLIFIHENLLVITFADDQTCVSPTEIIHAPERIDRQEETVNRVSKQQNLGQRRIYMFG